MRASSQGQLRRLARLCGVQPSFIDATGRRRFASVETLLAILRSLGVEIRGPDAAAEALEAWRRARWSELIEPVVTAWVGEPARAGLRLPACLAGGRASWVLKLESGRELEASADVAALAPLAAAQLGKDRFEVRALPLPANLPAGYHRLRIEVGPLTGEALVIAAPAGAYAPPDGDSPREWGVFLPLYALDSADNLGAGHLGDLRGLAEWSAGLGGGVLATLPLLASLLGPGPFEPSPYGPASRLFWNEFYLDPAAIPELADCAEARAVLETESFRAEVARFQKERIIDYQAQMALRRRVFEPLARQFFTHPRQLRRVAFERYRETHPAAADYAAFRAACERREAPWPAWPEPMRSGILSRDDYCSEARDYHLYVQWLAHEQIHDLDERLRVNRQHLYLDLPLGVHPDGYDAWRHRNVFAEGVSGGAPPDAFFSLGQDWGFPPLHPESIRREGYHYFIRSVRRLMRHCSILRIDHVMSLHRLYWIPRGRPATEGAYVGARAPELYAILNLESHRRRTRLVGEDLGTVPPYVRETMSRRGLGRMYVIQFSVGPDDGRPIHEVPAGSVASLNTHDMPTFTSFWEGLEIDDRVAMGLIDPKDTPVIHGERRRLREALVHYFAQRCMVGEGEVLPQIVAACLKFLARGEASVVLVNLEDLWLERRPQNVPGTHRERPNWRRKAARTLEAITADPALGDLLREIDALRKNK